MLTYIPNSGGMGVTLPYNLLFIGWLGLTFIILTVKKGWRNKSPQYQPLLLAGAGLVVARWMVEAQGNPGVWILLAAILLWCLLAQLHLTPANKRIILQAVFWMALAQAALGLIQIFFPAQAAQWLEYDWLRNGGRPYGIFQQVNLLASFMAAGIGCGFLLMLTASRRHAARGFIAGLGVLTFTLALNQSRTGELGAAVTIVLLILVNGRKALGTAVAALATMALAAWVGGYVIHHLHVLINGQPYLMEREYSGSTHERWNILCITWRMIMERPWLGWGYGTFEYEFSRWVLAHPETGYHYSSIVPHPHNELLFAWFQGGVAALSGMLLLLAGWLKMAFRAYRLDRNLAGCTLLIVPLLTHLCLEYPFYQSFVHFALFLLLLRLGISDSPVTRDESNSSLVAQVTAVFAGVCLLAFSAVGVYTNHQLTALERNNLRNYPVPSPWYFATQPERASFDGMVALLIAYNQTHDEKNLAEFMDLSDAWCLRHNDKKVWQSRIMIAAHEGNTEQKMSLQEMYVRLFPAEAVGQEPNQ